MVTSFTYNLCPELALQVYANMATDGATDFLLVTHKSKVLNIESIWVPTPDGVHPLYQVLSNMAMQKHNLGVAA